MTSDKRNIPTPLRRKVLVEAGHRCAIPTCRHIDVDVHHIIPWETCRKHEYDNLIALCPNCHRRADKGEIDRKSLIHYKNNLIYLYDKFTIFEIDVLYELNKIPPDKSLMFLPSLSLLIKRIIDAGYVKYTRTPTVASIGGLKSNPDFIKITDKGKNFLDDILNKNIGY